MHDRVIFDSNCPEDVNRHVKMISIKAEDLVSFEPIQEIIKDDKGLYSCEVSLVINSSVFPVVQVKLKLDQNVEMQALKQALNQGIAQAYSQALDVNGSTNVDTKHPDRSNVHETETEKISTPKTNVSSWAGVCIAFLIPLVIVLVYAYFKEPNVKPAPNDDSYAAKYQDPKQFQEQVELTRRTLQEMGLDPGQSIDTGCLAPVK